MESVTVLGHRRGVRAIMALLASGMVLAACADDDLILPGKREGIRSVLQEDTSPEVAQSASEPRGIALPAQSANANWPQSFGTPSVRTENAALSDAPQLMWSANIGSGDSRKQRITAAPVVADGLIYTLDADALVTATNTSGQTVWKSDVRPARDKDGQATGGGLAYDDGKVFVSLGYGDLVALDAASGSEIWRQSLGGTASGMPTIVNGLVYLTAGDDSGWAISADDGRVQWQITASPDVSNVLGAPAPAVGDGLAVFAFGSGEVQAVFQRGGLRRWDASVAGERFGAALGNVGDVTAAPVITGNRVYLGNQSGRVVALNLGSGERLWTAREGATGNIIPVGDSVFIISDLNELLRLDAATGARIWGVQLPRFVKNRPGRRAEVVAHHGPILAGGRLYVASNDELLRSFDPATGTALGVIDLPGGATSNPVVAGGALYVVSTKGKLHAFR